MIKDLLRRAIEQRNAFMTPTMIELQMQFFLTAGKITQAEYDELDILLEPLKTPTTQETSSTV